MLTWHMLQQMDFGALFLAVPKGQDVMLNLQTFWQDLLKTGKLAAGVIGFILGFLIKSITS